MKEKIGNNQLLFLINQFPFLIKNLHCIILSYHYFEILSAITINNPWQRNSINRTIHQFVLLIFIKITPKYTGSRYTKITIKLSRRDSLTGSMYNRIFIRIL